MVDLVSSFPNTIVGRAVSALDVKDQILDEIDLVGGVDDQNSRSGHLGKG